MSRKFLLWAMALVVIVPAVLGVAYWIYWDQFIRYAPVTITDPADQKAVQDLLDRVDYVSPGRTGAPWIYLITYRSCVKCRAYEEQEFPKFDAAGIDTRVVVFALPDSQGLTKSSTAERTTIAELWLNRKWSLYQQWFLTSDQAWKPDNLPIADNDMARSAVVGAGRDFVNQLGPLLRQAKITPDYPLLIWRDKDDHLKVCACSNEKAYHFIREDLNVGDTPGSVAGFTLPNLPAIPANLLPSGSENSTGASEPSSAAAASASSSASVSASKASIDYGPGAH